MTGIPISLTERAAVHVKRFLAKKGNSDAVRVGVKKTGCSGFAYVIEPAAEVNATDQVFESNGVKIVINAESLPLLSGMEVDYAREGLNETFRFSNPNVKATCGCGESFTV